MAKVIWAPSALAEVTRIFDFLAEFDPRAAARVAAELLAAGDSLTEFPRRGRLVPGSELRELVTRRPYIIRYRIAGDDVRILRVRHAARQRSDS